VLAEKRGNPDAAKDHYHAALRIFPQYTKCLDNLGVLYRKENNIDEAIKMYKRSLEIDRFGEVARGNLGLAYLAKGEPEAALGAFEILKNSKSNPEGYYGAARALAQLRRYEEALVQLDVAKKLYRESNNPWLADALLLTAELYTVLHDQSAARKAIDELRFVCANLEDKHKETITPCR
jgi:tetratricopeptide (TPR) repeat protein